MQFNTFLATKARAPDAVVVPHHIDALCVRQVAVLYEEVEDASAAELKLLSDDALQVRHHAASVQVHEQPAHAAIDDGRRRVVKVQAHADKVIATSSHHCKPHAKTHCSCSAGINSSISDRNCQDKTEKKIRPSFITDHQELRRIGPKALISDIIDTTQWLCQNPFSVMN